MGERGRLLSDAELAALKREIWLRLPVPRRQLEADIRTLLAHAAALAERVAALERVTEAARAYQRAFAVYNMAVVDRYARCADIDDLVDATASARDALWDALDAAREEDGE